MKLNIKKAYKYITPILVCLCFFVIFTLVGRLYRGSYTFMHIDFLCQYAPAYKMFWRNILEGKSLLYSFDFNLGMEMIPEYAFYSCFSPFTIFYAFIDNINLASELMVMCKLAMAGFCFYLYVSKVNKKDSLVYVAIALFYALNSYSVSFYYNCQLLDGAYMLPLVMLCIDRFFESRKAFNWLPICYAYIFIVNFYEGYIIGIISFIYFLLRLFMGNESDKRFSSFLYYVKYVFFSVLISAFITLPTAYAIFANRVSADEDSIFLGIACNILDILGNAFIGQMQSTDGYVPLIYCGIPSLILFSLFIISKNVEKKEKLKSLIILGLMLISCLISPLYIMWHAFDVPDSCGYRFAYLIAFIMASTVANNYEKLLMESRFKACAAGVILFFIYLSSHIVQRLTWNLAMISSDMLRIEINGFFIIMYISLFFIYKTKNDTKSIKIVFLGLVAIEVILNGFFCNSRMETSLIENKQVYQMVDSECKTAINEIEKTDGGIYRIHYENGLGYNNSQQYGYKSLGSFSSIENTKLRDVLFRLGYATSPRIVCDYGSSPLMRMLLGQKYVVHGIFAGDEKNSSSVLWAENPYSFSIGFCANEEVTDVTLEGHNAFENQNKLLQSILGEEVQFWLPVTNEIGLKQENVLISNEDNGYVFYVENGNTGNVQFFIEGDNYSNIYAYFEESVSSKTPLSPRLFSQNGDCRSNITNSYVTMPYLLRMGVNDINQYTVTMQFGEETSDSVKVDAVNFMTYDEEALKTAYDRLKDKQLCIDSFTDTKIQGHIVADDDEVLFTSIPYSRNWKIFVDGNQAESKSLINDSFLGCDLEKGEHTIELVYADRIFTLGLIISIIGVILLCVDYGLHIKSEN